MTACHQVLISSFDDCDDDAVNDDEDDLVVSILILDMLGNESHRVDRFLKVRLLLI